jgi:hypothetical protein
MSQPRCSRLWQAEAVLDRRLSAADCAAFDRHAQSCADCSRERDELSRLKQLGLSLPSVEATPLSRKRQRNELLKRAHQTSVSGTPRREWALPRWAWGLALPGAALVLALGLWLLSVSEGGPGTPKFETRAAPNTLWTASESGPRARLSLSDGSLHVVVQKLGVGQSFVITLPDGELEVRGTRFVVDVKAPRTERVSVSEGLVALRIRGQLELLLRAGDTWTAPVAQLSAPTSPSALPSTPSAPPTAVARASASAPPSSKPVGASPSASPVASASPPHQFGEAMAAYTRGDFASAEQLFQRFEANNPRSSQSEDSLFLRALSRQRRGDAAGAKQLAAQYLRRYPDGFRAAEARRLLEAP